MAAPAKECRACRDRLNSLELPDGTVEYLHGDPRADHDPVPGPLTLAGRLLCDWCATPDPTWKVLCTPFRFIGSNGVETQDNGLWQTCDVCAAFVAGDDWAGLTEHALRTTRELVGHVPDVDEIAILELHDQVHHHFVELIQPVPCAFTDCTARPEPGRRMCATHQR